MLFHLDHLRVRTRLMLSGLIIFLMVLVAIVVSWRGYSIVDQAGISALRYANDATHLQSLIKDINQYVLTEGAKAVRSRIEDSARRIDLQLDEGVGGTKEARAAAQKLVEGWRESRQGVMALFEDDAPSVENFEFLGKVVRVVARLDGLGGEVNALAEQARSDGAATARRVGMFVGAMSIILLLFIAVIFVLLNRSLRRQLGTDPEVVSTTVHQISTGDLQVNLDVDGRGFLPTSLLGAMKQMIDRLTDVVRNIDDTNRQVSQSAFQIAEMSRQMERSNEEQQNRAQQVRQATDELTESSKEVYSLADAARQRTERTEAQANDGLSAVEETLVEIKKTVADAFRAEQELNALADSAKEINHIIESIAAIAAQTNLLSLNAAIEAARAGEQGRGFAVVADEVRKLANRTSDATKEITAIVNSLSTNILSTSRDMSELVASTKSSNEKSQATGVAIEKMVELVRENGQSNMRISEASVTQMQMLEAFSGSLLTLFNTLQEGHEKVNITSQVSEDLYRTVGQVSKQMEYFRYERTHHFLPAQHEKRRGPRVSNTLLVMLRADVGTFQLISCDFSMGGMCIKTTEPLPLREDDTFDLSIKRPQESFEQYTAQRPCDFRGRLAWIRPPEDGVRHYGVEFIDVTAQHKECLKSLFDYYHMVPEFEPV